MKLKYAPLDETDKPFWLGAALMPSTRHFPAPWSAEVQPNYYVIRNPDGQQIAYIYYSNDPDRRSKSGWIFGAEK